MERGHAVGSCVLTDYVKTKSTPFLKGRFTRASFVRHNNSNVRESGEEEKLSRVAARVSPGARDVRAYEVKS